MEIHGGPHTTYGNVFFHEFQMLAGHGFGVFYTNPRGSMGYGEEFARVVVGDWCGVDAEDLEFMAREALRMFDWVDPERFGVTGGSQGGYFHQLAHRAHRPLRRGRHPKEHVQPLQQVRGCG
ncbi:MAG: prolyl oligopeptidase family serine peptidase [Bacillota bacterium]